MINKSYLANSVTTQLSRDIQSIRERIDRTSSEAVTGRTADPTAHLSGQIGRAMIANDALNKIDRDSSLLQIRESRLDITQQSLSRMQEGLAEISVRALDSLSAGSPVERTALAQDARAQLDSALMALNSRHGERFLFSGDATDKAAFGSPDDLMEDLRAIADAATDKTDFDARLNAYFDLDTGDFANSFYRGSKTNSDGDAITGLDPAITQTLRNLGVLAMAAPGDGLDNLSNTETLDVIRSSADRLVQADAALTQLRAANGILQERVATGLDSLAKEKLVVNTLLEGMTSRDQYEAAAELKALEASLEASYMLTARLSQLSLMNFLR
ncbi:flagellin [Henriciella marina]|uniref:Flagellin n=1 Tax=Henriciella marina TaxID=453851 RepID=A0ABT4LV60_9PROT|nr:flagellin [Henriciella marina]MCH2456788.1 hypothetical protein [Henriciella sp.]MCZ4297423.1 flagellin [Henriciella marina]